jgi:hypothetical protein
MQFGGKFQEFNFSPDFRFILSSKSMAFIGLNTLNSDTPEQDLPTDCLLLSQIITFTLHGSHWEGRGHIRNFRLYFVTYRFGQPCYYAVSPSLELLAFEWPKG